MKTSTKYMLFLSLIICISGQGCKKYLETKSDQKLAVPASLDALQGLLDNYSVLSQTVGGAGEASSDNFYLETSDWKAINSENERRLYTWQNDYLFAQDGSLNEWYCNYQAIYYANTVLKSLNTIERNAANQVQWDNIKGQAHLYRGLYFLRTATIWALAYDTQSSATDLGIPLRLTDDFNETSVRANVEESYNQILTDLKASVSLLPVSPGNTVRPSKPAAYGLLARTNLAMRRYKEAGAYADSSLMLYNKLIDFNTLDSTAEYPINQFNDEVVLWNRILPPALLSNSIAKIDAALYHSYTSDDLRKAVFFIKNVDGSVFFKGYYEGLPAPFGGIATDEILLTRAECSARTGSVVSAMQDLNQLLKNRFKTGKFADLTETNPSTALALILTERRKELVIRDLRWMDLKRLNKDGANITLQRTLDGNTYTLKPNDIRYALPIPENVIALSGMQQNKR